MASPLVPGATKLTTLTGSELVDVITVGPQSAVATAALVAGLSARTSVAEVVTALNTVGNGTITAAGIVGGITNRGGTQTAARTDTTATAALIIAALPSGAPIGTSWEWTYRNNTVFPMTIAGGTGVTISNTTIIAPNSSATFLVTYTAAATVTIAGYAAGFVTANNGTFVANGATPVTVTNATLTASSVVVFGLNTVGGTVGATPAVKTVTPGTGFTVACTASDTSTYTYLILG